MPLRPKEAAKRREALRRKALQRAHSRVELGEPHNSGLGRLIEAAKNKLHLPLGGDLERMGSGELAPRSPSAAEQAGECVGAVGFGLAGLGGGSGAELCTALPPQTVVACCLLQCSCTPSASSSKPCPLASPPVSSPAQPPLRQPTLWLGCTRRPTTPMTGTSSRAALAQCMEAKWWACWAPLVSVHACRRGPRLRAGRGLECASGVGLLGPAG